MQAIAGAVLNKTKLEGEPVPDFRVYTKHQEFIDISMLSTGEKQPVA